MHHHHIGEKVRMERKEVVANHGICSFCRHVEILFIFSTYVLLWITQGFFFFFFFVIYIFFIVFAIWYFLMPKDMDDCQQV